MQWCDLQSQSNSSTLPQTSHQNLASHLSLSESPETAQHNRIISNNIVNNIGDIKGLNAPSQQVVQVCFHFHGHLSSTLLMFILV